MYYACEHFDRPVHLYSTRFKSSGSLSTPNPSNGITQRSVNSNFIRIYNDLPSDIRTLFENPDARKKKLLKKRLWTLLATIQPC